MTLKSRLCDELNRTTVVAGEPPAHLSLDLDDGRLTCVVTAVDQLACAWNSSRFQTSKLELASSDALKKIATILSQRLSYLLESISPIETDHEGCVVQMRSSPPHKDDDGTSYYELVARRGELSLCRYTKAGGQTHRLVPALVTREVFYRLAQDLSSVPAA